MKMFARFFIPVVLMVLSISWLQAQVMVVSQTQQADRKGSGTETLYIDKDRLCMETKAPGNNTAVVYRPGPVMLIMDMDKGTYMEMNKEDFDQMKAMIKQTNKQMEEKKKTMTPDQQKLMEKYMPKGAMDAAAGAEPEKTVYKKVGGAKVGNWVCNKYEGYDGSEKVEDVWSTDLKNLGVTPEDVKVFEDFAKLFEEFSQGKNKAAFRIGSKEFEEEQGYPGVAVKTVEYDGDRVVSTREVVQVEKKSGFDDALFQPRPGLKKTDNYMKQMQQQKMPSGY